MILFDTNTSLSIICELFYEIFSNSETNKKGKNKRIALLGKLLLYSFKSKQVNNSLR